MWKLRDETVASVLLLAKRVQIHFKMGLFSRHVILIHFIWGIWRGYAPSRVAV